MKPAKSCIYCEHHKMLPTGRIGAGTCSGGGDLKQRPSMRHEPFDLLVGYYFGDSDGECSNFKEKIYQNEV